MRSKYGVGHLTRAHEVVDARCPARAPAASRARPTACSRASATRRRASPAAASRRRRASSPLEQVGLARTPPSRGTTNVLISFAPKLALDRRGRAPRASRRARGPRSRTRARPTPSPSSARLDRGHDDVAAAVVANDARCGSGPSWNVSISANGGWFSSAARRTTSASRQSPACGIEPDEERLPALVHVLEVAALLELARVVPGPHRAAHGADADVAAADVVAVLRVVHDGRARARRRRRRPTPGPAPRRRPPAARGGRTASRTSPRSASTDVG